MFFIFKKLLKKQLKQDDTSLYLNGKAVPGFN